MKLPTLDIGAPTIRPLAAADYRQLLCLNAENRPEVAPLDEGGLAHLLQCDGYHLVAVDERGTVVGYLLSFPRESQYNDTEFCWFRERLFHPFFYICQVVVAVEHRRQKIARAFYQDLFAAARKRGSQILCCDVNTDPPNFESFAFHRRLGFVTMGFGHASEGTEILYLVHSQIPASRQAE